MPVGARFLCVASVRCFWSTAQHRQLRQAVPQAAPVDATPARAAPRAATGHAVQAIVSPAHAAHTDVAITTATLPVLDRFSAEVVAVRGSNGRGHFLDSSREHHPQAFTELARPPTDTASGGGYGRRNPCHRLVACVLSVTDATPHHGVQGPRAPHLVATHGHLQPNCRLASRA